MYLFFLRLFSSSAYMLISASEFIPPPPFPFDNYKPIF